MVGVVAVGWGYATEHEACVTLELVYIAKWPISELLDGSAVLIGDCDC